MAKAKCCQYCGQTLPEMRLGVRLPPLKARIFDVIQRAGEDGISGRDLFDIIYAEEQKPPARATLKAHINQINDVLEESEYSIVGGGYYRLKRRIIK